MNTSTAISLPDDSRADAPPGVAQSTGSSLLREPLLHFVLLGALLFGIDHLRNANDAQSNVITVGKEVDMEARAMFRNTLGRIPTDAEMKTLRERWIDNEVLYREGLAMRVDQGDATIRERVIFKALNVMQANLTLPPIDEPGLRIWFAQHHARYDEPDRFDFLEAVVAGKPDKATIDAFVLALNTGKAEKEGATNSDLRVFSGRPRSNLVASYGEAFAADLNAMPAGQWRALASSDGVHIVRLEKKIPGQPASFDSVRATILDDWKDATMQDLRTAAVRELGKKYTVSVAGAGQ